MQWIYPNQRNLTKFKRVLLINSLFLPLALLLMPWLLGVQKEFSLNFSDYIQPVMLVLHLMVFGLIFIGWYVFHYLTNIKIGIDNNYVTLCDRKNSVKCMKKQLLCNEQQTALAFESVCIPAGLNTDIEKHSFYTLDDRNQYILPLLSEAHQISNKKMFILQLKTWNPSTWGSIWALFILILGVYLLSQQT